MLLQKCTTTQLLLHYKTLTPGHIGGSENYKSVLSQTQIQRRSILKKASTCIEFIIN